VSGVVVGNRVEDQATGALVDLTLDKLQLSFENNLYAVHLGQGLFHWGCEWSRHKMYASLEDVRADLKVDKDSRVGEFLILNYHTRDFLVPTSALAREMGVIRRGMYLVSDWASVLALDDATGQSPAATNAAGYFNNMAPRGSDRLVKQQSVPR